MKKYVKPIIAAILLGVCAASVYAIPAKKGVRTFTQADGTAVEVELVGDEFAHMYVTADGYPLVEENGILYYAGITPDGTVERCGLKAVSASSRGAAVNEFLKTVDRGLVGKALEVRASSSKLRQKAEELRPGLMRAPKGPGLFPAANFPVTGSPRVLVILAEYDDVSMTINNAHDYFTRMMTERGFSDYGGTGSAIDYFDENSNGLFTPQIDVYGPVKLPRKRAYYGANDSWGHDKNAEQMIVDACEALDDEIDFSKYDNDGDGVVDNVYVFYAGRGEADGGSAETIWPHSYNLTYAYINRYFDGVKIDRYACSNEYGDRRPDGVGTFVHEFSHVMGLPDLYTTGYTGAFTPGSWSALDYGPYNNDGCTPPLYSAFERYALGWIEPVVIDGPMSAVLRPIGDNVCGIIKTGKDSEFFLLENRQKTSWDKYIPGHGMLVWHIDYNGTIWTQNTVNNSPSHQYVDIEEADGTKTEYSRAGDAFPGTSNVRSFTDTTKPSMKTWTGKSLNLPITNITEADGLISFDVSGGSSAIPVETPKALEASNIELTGFTANWEAAEGMSYLLSVYRKDVDGRPLYTKYNRTNVGAVSSVTIDELESDTKYYYTVTAMSGFNMSEPSNEIEVNTLRMGINCYPVVALAASDISGGGFTANWEALAEATSYFLSVYELTTGEPLEFTTGFDNGVFPDGWSSTGHSSIGMASFCGNAAPSVGIADGKYIETADYGEIYSLSFWHRATSTSTGKIEVSVKIDGEWDLYVEYDIMTSAPGKTTELELPAGTSAVRIGFSGTGNLRLDDISMSYGYSTVRTVVPPYDKYAVGNVTSYVVEGLESGRNYSYTVQASDGEKESKLSGEVRVNTGDNSGIGGVDAGDGLKLIAAGGVVTVWGIAEEIAVEVFDIAGRKLAEGRGSSSFKLGRGLYIVRAGASSAKLLMK